MWKPHIGGGTPRNFGPCGDVLDRNRTLLFTHFERRYPYLLPVMPPAESWGLIREQPNPHNHLDFDRIHPEDRSRIIELRFGAARTKRNFEAGYRLLLPGGVIKYVYTVGHRLISESGAIEYVGAVMDITEHKKTEENLRRSEAFLAEAQRLSSTGSFSWRVATDEITWSDELYRIFERGSANSSTAPGPRNSFIQPLKQTTLWPPAGNSRPLRRSPQRDLRLLDQYL